VEIRNRYIILNLKQTRWEGMDWNQQTIKVQMCLLMVYYNKQYE